MKLLRNTLLFVALAALFNLAVVAVLPSAINFYAMHEMAKRAGGRNRALVSPRPDASARTVVRPSPDLLYTVCAFDVSAHALRISAPVQDSYVSISGFAADTSNFFAVNDAAIPSDADGKKHFDLILTRNAGTQAPPGTRVIVAPSDRGVILFRSLITRDADVARLRDDFQAHQTCTEL